MTSAGLARVWSRNWTMVAGLQVCTIVVAAVGLGLWWKPQPHSDWLHYWLAAGEPSLYERGGIGLWLLAIPKSLGLAPELAALVLNVPAALWLSWLAVRVDDSRGKWFAQLVLAYLLLITPYMGVVQLDLVAAASLAAGLWLLLDPRPPLQPLAASVVAAVAIVLAVSTGPQYALTLWSLLGVCIVLVLVAKRWRTRRNGTVLTVLLLASVAGFCTDM